ncbi:MAG: hypothetical protein U0641_11790 [Anaerolineae bacterium]
MRLATTVAILALVSVVLMIAGVAVADGPQGITTPSQLTLPYAGAYSGATAAFLVQQQAGTRSASSPAIYGVANADDGGWFTSVSGNGSFNQGNNAGVWAQGVGYGVYAVNLGAGPGVYGLSTVQQGVVGINNATTRSDTPGVQGQGAANDGGWFLSQQGNGVYGQGPNAGVWAAGVGQGVYATASNGNAINAQGSQIGVNVTGGTIGANVYGTQSGLNVSTSSSGTSAILAVNPSAGNSITSISSGGVAVNATGGTNGVIGTGTGNNANGIVGIARTGGSPYAIWGQATTAGYAGFFSGNVQATGSIIGSLAATKLDDPTAPTQRYLNQAAVTSGEMLTMVNGNVVTDANGDAVVKVPAYVEALSKDFRYQLTTIGQPAQAYVAKELKDGEFVIHTDRPSVKVSWQVSGARNDPYAQSLGWSTVEDKVGADKGTYLHPEAYGQSKSLSVDAARIAALNRTLDAAQSSSAMVARSAGKFTPDLTPRPDLQPAPPAVVPPEVGRPARDKQTQP